MDGEWQAILARYGQSVTVSPSPEEESVTLRAMLQPMLERGEQIAPSPLGGRREDRFLYLGPRDTPLRAGESLVECGGTTYRVQAAHLVGEHHWWAVLRPCDKEGQ